MSTKLSEIQVLFQTRNARQRGPTSSDQFNDMVAEIAHDLSTLNDQWNNRLIPLITPVPDGTSDVSIDAYANGLDGANLLVKQDASNTTYSTYYNSASTRPNSVYEQFAEVYSNINVIRDDLEYQITNITSSASQLSITDSASLYDSTNVEDALAEVMQTANSAASSAVNNLQEAFDGGQTITVSDGDDQTLTFNQNDVTNNPNAVVINNAGTGINLLLSSSDDDATKLSMTNSDGGHTFQVMVTGSAAGIGADKFSIYDSIGAAHRLTIDSSGQVGINNSSPGAALDIVGNVELEDSTTSGKGVISKNSVRFLHNFHHPTGGGAIPAGENIFLGESAGNFTLGSTATQTYHSSNNIGIGSNSLDALTTGYRNIGIGLGSLTGSTTAFENVSIGYNTLVSNQTGNYNVGIGSGCLTVSTTSYNTAIGYYALNGQDIGSNNVAIGSHAGQKVSGGVNDNESSANSVYIGCYTRASSDGNTNEIIIGDQVTGQGSNTVTIGNDSTTDFYINADLTVSGIQSNGGALFVGGSTATSHDLDSGDTVFGGNAEFNSQVFFDGNAQFIDSSFIYFGNGTSGSDAALKWNTTGNDNLMLSMGVGTANTSGYFIITKDNNKGIDHGHGATSDPTLRIFSGYNVGTDDTKYIEIYHDQTDGAIQLGSGNLNINADLTISGLDVNDNIELNDTTSSALGVITKDGTRFLHNFHHPTGGGALPDGGNIFLGELAGNFTMGSTATQTYHASSNIGIGNQALDALTIGYRNVAVGARSLSTTQNNSNNVAIGYQAQTSATGSNNVAIGSSALTSVSGVANTGIGYFALYNITSGASNIALGSDAGRFIAGGVTFNQTSSYSVYLGNSSKASADGNTGEIVIGNDTTGHGSNTVTIGNNDTTDLYFNGDVTCSGIQSNGGALFVGSTTSTSHSLDSGDTIFGGKAEFEDAVFIDSYLHAGDNVPFYIGGALTDSGFRWSTAQTNNGLLFYTETGSADQSGNILITKGSNKTFDHAHPVSANPKLIIHSNNQSADEWISFTHDQTDGVIDVGTGNVKIATDLTVSGVDANGDVSVRVGDKIIFDNDQAGNDYIFNYSDGDLRILVANSLKLQITSANTSFYNNNLVIATAGKRIYSSAEALSLGTIATTNHGLATGDIICGGKAEFDDDVYMDADLEVSGVVSVNGQISSLIPTTLIPTGTTQTVDWNDGNMQIIDLDSATGDVTLTLSNPASGASYIIKTIQGGTARDLVFPAAVLHQEGITPTLSVAEDAIDVITMAYDGTYYLANTGKNYS